MRWLMPALAAVATSAPLAATAGEYAPLNCAKASTATERTICGSYALGQQEARMATLYAIATSLVGMGRRGDIQDHQREWLEARESCGKRFACLQDAYDRRIRELNDVVASVASHGPF